MDTIIDNYKEHGLHEYDPHCSTCFNENRLIQAHKVVNIPKVEMLPKGWGESIIRKIIWGK